MVSTIGDLANRVGFRGASPNHVVAEPGQVMNLPVVDHADPSSKNNVRTSVDCYVSGQYVSRKGKMFEVTQRYTIFVAYSKSTQLQAMSEVRSRITNDFQAKYGQTFNVTSVFIPSLPVPVGRSGAGEEQFYGGSDLFKAMTRRDRARYEIDTERLKARTNIGSIRGRYAGGR